LFSTSNSESSHSVSDLEPNSSELRPAKNVRKNEMQKFLYGFISAILILLAISIIYPWQSNTIGCTKCYKAIAEINAQSLAIELYYSKFGKLPSNEEGMEVLVGEFIEELNHDPWGGKYFYSILNFDNRKCYVIWSFGSDLKPGGEKESEQDFFIFGKNKNCL
jgi:hypothetical protein